MIKCVTVESRKRAQSRRVRKKSSRSRSSVKSSLRLYTGHEGVDVVVKKKLVFLHLSKKAGSYDALQY